MYWNRSQMRHHRLLEWAQEVPMTLYVVAMSGAHLFILPVAAINETVKTYFKDREL